MSTKIKKLDNSRKLGRVYESHNSTAISASTSYSKQSVFTRISPLAFFSILLLVFSIGCKVSTEKEQVTSEIESTAIEQVGIASGSTPLTSASTKIVRGANSCPLDAMRVGQGNNPTVKPDEPLDNLSVNASDDSKVNFATLASTLKNTHFATTTLGELRKKNKFVQIVRAPEPGNPYHSLLSVITPKEFISKVNCKEK